MSGYLLYYFQKAERHNVLGLRGFFALILCFIVSLDRGYKKVYLLVGEIYIKNLKFYSFSSMNTLVNINGGQTLGTIYCLNS